MIELGEWQSLLVLAVKIKTRKGKEHEGRRAVEILCYRRFAGLRNRDGCLHYFL